MKISTIRWVFVLACLALAGIFISQVFWIRKGLLINQSNFETAVNLTLENIAHTIETKNSGFIKTENPVVRLSPRSYLVDINEPIDINFLDHRLKTDFANPFHKVDFEFDVIERKTNEVVYSDSVFVDVDDVKTKQSKILPVLDASTYYFKVNFPDRPVITSVMITIWIIAIVILLSVLLFFSYSLNVIIRQRRLSEFQKGFINNLAHEFKTPISTIGISAEVLNDDEILNEPERLKHYASIIGLENNRLKNQVGKILELARLENDELTLSLEKFNINEVLQQITDAFKLKIAERNGTIKFSLLATHPEIKADKVHFINVINTLLDNALKYSDEAPHIEISAKSSGKQIQVSIKDNGIGIPKEFHKKIFEKFFRVPTGNVHNVKGFGLGLNYAKMIAHAHKWNIHVDSELNKGSIFTITI